MSIAAQTITRWLATSPHSKMSSKMSIRGVRRASMATTDNKRSIPPTLYEALEPFTLAWWRFIWRLMHWLAPIFFWMAETLATAIGWVSGHLHLMALLILSLVLIDVLLYVAPIAAVAIILGGAIGVWIGVLLALMR
jgi:hypothetical protein